MDKTIRALVVDDEPLAGALLRQLLGEHPDVQVVATAKTAAEAAEICAADAPDVLFLDIDMPRGNGFELLRALASPPAVIFTTAHSSFAVDAFDFNAVDYVLKPIDRDRLRRALHRLRQKLANRVVRGPAAPPASNRIALRMPSQIVFIPANELEWIAAEGNYCRVHATGRKPLLVREMVSELEQRLDPRRFVRVHRSSIVNVEQIEKIVTDDQGRQAIVLQSGATVRVGASHREQLQRLLSESQ